MSRGFVDKGGNRIDIHTFHELSKDKSYGTLREFENEKLYARAFWHGVIENPAVVPKEHWKPFGLEVLNILYTDAEGNAYDTPRRVKDPDASRHYRTEREAVEAYEALLAQYGGCHYEEREVFTVGGRTEVKKVLVEVDNKAVPPDKNVPRVDRDTKGAEDFGTW